MDGLLVVDKPVGPTSHDVVARVRRALREPRVGHTGTLDPAASGVLPLVIGRATRLARFLAEGDKTYEAAVRLGVATDTFDAEGVPIGSAAAGPLPSREQVEAALAPFRGTYPQRPPAYSAKKIAGQRSYALARGAAKASRATPAPNSTMVTVHALEVLAYEADLVTLRVSCGAGFYVRSLADDLGRALGVGAHLSALCRTLSSGLSLADAVSLDVVERDRDAALSAIVPLAAMLPGLPAAVLTAAGAVRLAHGRDLGPADLLGAPAADSRPVRLMTTDGALAGIGVRAATPGFLHPDVVLM
jgi:tRNA pseudouridine55 synthase